MAYRKFKQKNKLTAYFNQGMADFLEDEHEETGFTKSDIMRQALKEYMWKRVEEKMAKREKIKQYLIDLYGEVK